MILGKDRQTLENELSQIIKESKFKRKNSKDLKDIKKHLLDNYQILEGEVQQWINDPDTELPKLDLRALILLTEQIYAKTRKVNPKEYFTKAEIREARQYSGVLEQQEKEIDFPITIPNVTLVGNEAYIAALDIKTIDKLIKNQLLNYNFDLQREAKVVKRKDVVILEPTLNKKNVREISQHLVNGTLVPTVLVFNAATRTALSGTELVYDYKKMELTIEKGTRLDIVDGYHRCRGSQLALQENPELNFKFAVLFTNYSTSRAKQYQAQIAKATPLSKIRIQELEASRLADIVVQQLRAESDLKGRISQTNYIHTVGKELVSYNVLADTIDEMFDMSTRADAADVGDYLCEMFNFLIDEYKEEFLNNPNEFRKISLINDNNMFVGYITLGSRMFRSGIKPRKIVDYIQKIDFNRSNPLWKQLGIVDESGNIGRKARKAIKEYFSKIDVNK